jgi:hypothetical protein
VIETETDESRRTRPILRQQQAGENEQKPSGLVQTLKDQFRAVMKVLTRAPEPRPQARRRTGEETGGAFRAAAKSVLRRAVRLPVIAYAAAFMWDTLDQLNPWQGQDANANEMAEDFHSTEQHNHLSPHP